jgi:hypothetical protein
MDYIELWNTYISEFNYTVEQTKKEKTAANLFFLQMLNKLYKNELDNQFKAIEILGYNYYNGYSIKVAHDSMYFNFKEPVKYFCISYSDKHVSAYKYNTDYIVKEYAIINRYIDSFEQYETAISLITRIVHGVTGI